MNISPSERKASRKPQTTLGRALFRLQSTSTNRGIKDKLYLPPSNKQNRRLLNKTMLPNKNTIIRESLDVYKYIQQKITCSFNELQNYFKLDSVHLCMALIELIKENKICQQSDSGNVSYSILS